MTIADEATTGNPALDAALRYADYGLRVVPIKPGTKRPPLDEWQNQATTNIETIRLWWKNNPLYGVGVATGQYGSRWLFCLDVDMGTDPKTGRTKEGDDSLADLETEHGELPTTVEGQSGSGGRHLWFWSPVEVTNDQAGKLGVDLDIRGVGGQIVCAPTMHPDTGRAYAWLVDQGFGETKVANAPPWLLNLLTSTANQEPRKDIPHYDGPPRPGDRLPYSWPQLLQPDGATFIGGRTDRRTSSAYELWARPGADHTSATLYYGGTDLLKVFSPNWPGLTQGETYTRFGYYTATRHGGDYRAAARALAAEQNDTFDPWDLLGGRPTEESPPGQGQQGQTNVEWNWKPADLQGVYAAGLVRPQPTVLIRSDQAGLLYPSKTNTIFGASGGGKTWLIYIAAAQKIADGEHVLILDWEDDAVSYLSRMIALGLPAELVIANSTYYPIGTAAQKEDIERIDQLIVERGTTFVGIDSTGEAIAAQGRDQDKDADVATWMGALPRRWARLGPCVTMVDHMPHGGGREIGSQRKRAGVSGAAYEAIATEPFAKNKPGTLTLKVAKDRGGNYAMGTEQAVIHFTPNEDGTVMGWDVQPGSGKHVNSKAKNLAEYEDRILEYLATLDGGQAKTTEIRANVPGDNAALTLALKALVSAGRVGRIEKGKTISFYLKEDQNPVT